MSIDVRKSVYDLLATLPTPIYHTRLDPFKADQYPVLSVQYDKINRTQIGMNLTYKVLCTFLITVAVATTDEDFDSQLDTLVDGVLNKLLTDPTWDTQFEYVGPIDTRYGYVQAGETDLATAVIQATVQYSEVFDPILPNVYTDNFFTIDHVIDDPNNPTTAIQVTQPN